MARILALARQWGWTPQQVAEMPLEYALAAREFMSSINFVKTVKSGK